MGADNQAEEVISRLELRAMLAKALEAMRPFAGHASPQSPIRQFVVITLKASDLTHLQEVCDEIERKLQG